MAITHESIVQAKQKYKEIDEAFDNWLVNTYNSERPYHIDVMRVILRRIRESHDFLIRISELASKASMETELELQVTMDIHIEEVSKSMDAHQTYILRLIAEAI